MSWRRRFTQIGSGTVISSTCAKFPSFSADVYDFLISLKEKYMLCPVTGTFANSRRVASKAGLDGFTCVGAGTVTRPISASLESNTTY
jgi:hypothetical protein